MDNDGNGLFDDLVGWDFVDDDNAPTDTNETLHGTAVAGIIAARTNNVENPRLPQGENIAGINWKASIIPLRIAEERTGTAEDVYDAIELAGDYGAKIANLSFTFKVFTNKGDDVDAELANHTILFDEAGGQRLLVVNSTGNGKYRPDNHGTLLLPAEIDRETIITVATVDSADLYYKLTALGGETVDVLAPGVNILTHSFVLLKNERVFTQVISGSSFAAPHVTGIAGLIFAHGKVNGLTPAGARQLIMDTVDDFSDPNVVSGGRVNALNALDAL